jgi:hypothetical protein
VEGLNVKVAIVALIIPKWPFDLGESCLNFPMRESFEAFKHGKWEYLIMDDRPAKDSPPGAASVGPDNGNGSSDMAIDNSQGTDKPWLWKKGQSGNSQGRPTSALIDHLRRRTHNGFDLIDTLVSIASRSIDDPRFHHPRYVLDATALLMDRLLGKAVIHAQAEGVAAINIVIAGPMENSLPNGSTAAVVESATIALSIDDNRHNAAE